MCFGVHGLSVAAVQPDIGHMTTHIQSDSLAMSPWQPFISSQHAPISPVIVVIGAEFFCISGEKSHDAHNKTIFMNLTVTGKCSEMGKEMKLSLG